MTGTSFTRPKRPQTNWQARKWTILWPSFPCPFRVWSSLLQVLASISHQNKGFWMAVEESQSISAGGTSLGEVVDQELHNWPTGDGFLNKFPTSYPSCPHSGGFLSLHSQTNISPHEKAWKIKLKDSFFSCVSFCLRSHEPFIRCDKLYQYTYLNTTPN